MKQLTFVVSSGIIVYFRNNYEILSSHLNVKIAFITLFKFIPSFFFVIRVQRFLIVGTAVHINTCARCRFLKFLWDI